jgi:endonuclease/exonuclease/phosphatase family metal-dependent hydrolase
MTEATRGDELIPGLFYKEFVEEAMRHVREDSFRASPFFARYGPALLNLLSTPRIDHASQGAPSRPTFRLVHWNIEKGKALSGLIHHLTTDPYLREADVWCLNEVDIGTARAGSNADIARELARALGCGAVYLPSYIECTKGYGSDLLIEGENRRGLHGLAVLSRWPIEEARMAPLPACFDYFSFTEKRFGFRQGLYVRLKWNDRPLIVATTHLEVRRTPRCRARQFAAFLLGLDEARTAWGREAPVVLSGDWNTNSFRRGGLGQSLVEFLRIVSTPAHRLDRELARPYRREPLFGLLAHAGYELDPFNEADATVAQSLGSVEDLDLLPRPVAELVSRTFRLPQRLLRMRLDWIAVRGLTAVAPPRTLKGLTHRGVCVSDHDPIGVDLGLR